MAKVMRKGARHTQRRDKPQETPCSEHLPQNQSLPTLLLYGSEHLPQNQSLPTLLLYALTYTSDFTGGCPPPPLSEKDLTCSSSQ